MDLQTIIKLEKPEIKIGYDTRMMMLGSCFVENIGEKLDYFKFDVDINPCGIVYNPVSVANTLQLLVEGRRFICNDLLQNGDRWVSFSHHGSFSDRDPLRCLQKINEQLELSSAHFAHTDVLVITWGTAWVYRYRQSGQLVSNCHKFPSASFDRFRLGIADIVNLYSDLLPRLKEANPRLKVLFTVSPIRHWKDGAHGNQLSKAVLLLAIDELMQRFDFVSYFPSYEIVMDELRDYRFYAEDMLHISPQGVNYIWEKFKGQYFTTETLDFMKRIDKLNKILLHRPSDPDSEATLQLRQQASEELKNLLDKMKTVK